MDLLYYVFGDNEDYKSELIYSIMSLKRVTSKAFRQDIKIFIYADHVFDLPVEVRFTEINFRVIPPEKSGAWMKAANGHFFIVKPMILMEFLGEFKRPCLLLDTDTFFHKSPESLFQLLGDQHFIIHLKECQFRDFSGLSEFFKDRVFFNRGHSFEISHSNFMFNCGVLGVHSGCMGLLKEVVSLIHQISAATDWPSEWSRVIEQTCFSYMIQRRGLKVSTAEDTILHYWFFKGCRYLLANKFRYFQPNDQGVVVSGLQSIPLRAFPELIAEMVHLHSLIPGFYLDFLPEDTMIGNLIRKAAIADLKLPV